MCDYYSLLRQTAESQIIFNYIIMAQLLKNINVDHLHGVFAFKQTLEQPSTIIPRLRLHASI